MSYRQDTAIPMRTGPANSTVDEALAGDAVATVCTAVRKPATYNHVI